MPTPNAIQDSDILLCQGPRPELNEMGTSQESPAMSIRVRSEATGDEVAIYAVHAAAIPDCG